MPDSQTLRPDEELALIRRAKAGDESARNALMVELLPIIHKNLSWRYPKLPAQDLNDILQDSVFEMVGAIECYDTEHPRRARLAHFLGKRLLGVVRRFYRHSDRMVEDDVLTEFPADSDPLVDLERDETASRVSAALDALPAQRRALLVTRYADGGSTSQRQLGESWGCTKQNIQKQEVTARTEFLAAWDDIAA